MKPMTIASLAFLAMTQFLGADAATGLKKVAGTKVRRDTPTQVPSTIPVPDQLTSHGCYSSGGNLTKQSSVEHVSSGSCGEYCTKNKYYVMGLHGSTCYCGMVYPPKKTVTDDDTCNYPCPGFGKEACGGLDEETYSIFNTGIEIDVPSYVEEEESTTTSKAAASTTDAKTTTTAAETTAAETTAAGTTAAEATSTESSDLATQPEEKKSTNVAAIAAGVVVGVVVFAAGAGALIFFVRRRRNSEIEEEHRRNAAVNAFISGSKPPGSSGSISMTDSRLDPVLAHRRLSDGSIADNQDYSRRILRVTNA